MCTLRAPLFIYDRGSRWKSSWWFDEYKVCGGALRDVVSNPGTLWLVCWCQLSERRWRPEPHCRRSLSYAGVLCARLVWCWSAPWSAMKDVVMAQGRGMRACLALGLLGTFRILDKRNVFPKVLSRKWCKRVRWEHFREWTAKPDLLNNNN